VLAGWGEYRGGRYGGNDRKDGSRKTAHRGLERGKGRFASSLWERERGKGGRYVKEKGVRGRDGRGGGGVRKVRRN
jgi:hypothetical protein